FSDGSGHTLAAGTVGSAAQACHTGSSCTAATNSGISLPLTLSTTAAKVFNAAVNTGLGKIDVTPQVDVLVPGNAYAGTYTATVNATVTAGATLSVAGNGTPSFSLTLNGDDQTKTYTLPVEVVDARGLAASGGWNLTVTSTQFSDGAGHSIPAAASTITGV